MGTAAPMIFTAAMGAAQYSAQGKIGKYNQAVNNRNALVLEGQAAQIEQKAEFDIAQFQKDFRKMEGETTVALAKSGVELGTGTAYNIELSNAYEAKLQENLIKYNSEVAAANKMEEANFARIRGTMAKQQARMAQIGTVAQTGSRLFSMMNKPKGTV
jgi:roadblock/LC7 domain-containing protein